MMGVRIGRLFGVWQLGAFALVALVVIFGLSPSTHDSRPASAALGSQLTIKWGDTNCDDAIDVKDVLAIEQYALGINLSSNDCRFTPNDPTDMLFPGYPIKAVQADALTYGGFWADFTCDRNVTPFDALSVLIWISGSWSDSQASHEVPIGCPDYDVGAEVTEIPIYPIPGPPGPVPEVAVDADTSGNSPAGLGPTDDCVAVQAGGFFDVDVVIKGIPIASLDQHGDFTVGGISSYSLDLWYDPAIVRAVGEDPRFLLQVLGSPHLIDTSNSLPDTDGRYHAAAFDSSAFYEYGDGVLVRFTFQTIAAGTTAISIGDPNTFGDQGVFPSDALNNVYEVTTVKDATVHVDGDCSTPTPTPSPTLTPSPTPTATPGPTTCLSETPTPTPSPTPTATDQFTSSPSPTPCVTPSPSPSPSPGPSGDNSCLNVDPPVAIPDHDIDGTNIIRHFDGPGSISSMNVCLDIAHQWVGDIVVRLTHQDTGTTRILVDRLSNHSGTCSGFGNGVYVLLTDDSDLADVSMEDECGLNQNIIGTFFPDQPFVNGLGTFEGEQIAGDWILNVRDAAEGGLGEIRGFRIDFNP